MCRLILNGIKKYLSLGRRERGVLVLLRSLRLSELLKTPFDEASFSQYIFAVNRPSSPLWKK